MRVPSQITSDQVRSWLMKPENSSWVEEVIAEHVAMIHHAGKWNIEPPKVAWQTWAEIMRERDNLQQSEQNRERAEHFEAMREFVQQFRRRKLDDE